MGAPGFLVLALVPAAAFGWGLAPTPVSAYLHAAAMVQAGIYLVARLAPGLSDVPGWRPTVLGLGLATMLVGGYRSLRQNDLKLLLAFGTVSQLIGAAIRLHGGSAAWMLLLVGAFQLVTVPVSAHMVSRIAHRRRHVRRDLLLVDELNEGPVNLTGDEPADGTSRAR